MAFFPLSSILDVFPTSVLLESETASRETRMLSFRTKVLAITSLIKHFHELLHFRRLHAIVNNHKLCGNSYDYGG